MTQTAYCLSSVQDSSTYRRGNSSIEMERRNTKREGCCKKPAGNLCTSRSLFVFGEENFVRKYARMIIEWGYPFTNYN